MTSADGKDGAGILTPEQYVERHKRAFRAAFDYLNAHFPPNPDDSGYWERAARDVSAAASVHNPLGEKLLLSVYEYLEDEFMKRRNGHGRTEIT